MFQNNESFIIYVLYCFEFLKFSFLYRFVNSIPKKKFLIIAFLLIKFYLNLKLENYNNNKNKAYYN